MLSTRYPLKQRLLKVFLVFLATSGTVHTLAAQLPALRVPSRFTAQNREEKSATSLALPGYIRQRRIDHDDDKRMLASRLLKRAASHKRRSLLDVLAQQTSPRSFKSTSTSSASHSSPSSPDEKAPVIRGPSADSKLRSSQDHNQQSEDHLNSHQAEVLHTIAAHLFPSRPNSTEHSRGFHPSLSLYIHDEKPSSSSSYSSSSSSKFTSTSMDPNAPQRAKQPEQQASRTGGATPENVKSTWSANAKRVNPPSRSKISGLSAETSTETEREGVLLRRSLKALNTTIVRDVTAALRVLQELCHSIHNGRAIETSGGIDSILEALSSRSRKVRATALWAVATCCQNNPPVQRAALERGAVKTLANLAWKDVLKVRARALFALNALLGMEEARDAFEKLPYATHVVTAALTDVRDFRATRRALNLIELLVGRNLDAWKTQLEAWDIPPIIENLMRNHSDVDVRESAARIIAALDGKLVG